MVGASILPRKRAFKQSHLGQAKCFTVDSLGFLLQMSDLGSLLPVCDICFGQIFSHLSIQDLFTFRSVCHQALYLVDGYFRQLDNLDLSSVDQVRFNWYHFVMIAQNNSAVRQLNLANSKWIQEPLFNRWIGHQRRLQSVNLSSAYKVTNTTMTSLAVSCPFLTTLIVQNCSWLNAETLSIVAECCRNLSHIDITSCWNLNDNSVGVLFEKRGATLTQVSLSHIYSISDESMATIETYGKVLSRLDISYCWRVTDNGIK